MRKALITTLLVIICSISGCRNGDNLTLQGYIEGRLIYISSQNSGALTLLPVERGDMIHNNQLLFQLDLNPQLSSAHEALANLNAAKAKLANLEKGKRPSELAAIQAQEEQVIPQITFASKTLQRYQHLYEKKALEKAKVDEAESNYKNLTSRLIELQENLITAKSQARADEIAAAKAEVNAAAEVLHQAAWQLRQKTIIAPTEGEIYDTYYRLGEVVPATHPVLSILTPQNIYAIFFVPEEQLSSIKIGQKISMTCDSCKQPTQASIYFISPKAEYTPPIIYSEKSRSKLIYRVEAKIPIQEAKRFHPGQPITVRLPEMAEEHGK